MNLILDHAGLTDAWVATHPQLDRSRHVSSPHEAISIHGVTADSPVNTYSSGKPLDNYARKFGGKRLDYVLYSSPKNSPSSRLNCTSCSVVMTERAPGHNFSYSDHFGLEATLVLEAAFPAAHSSNKGITQSTISTTMQALSACHQFSRHRSHRELLVFGLCLLLLLGLTISSSWLVPSAWNPLVILFAVFLSWLATTMLYSGFIFGNWECNALMGCIEELELLSRVIEEQSQSASPGHYFIAE